MKNFLTIKNSNLEGRNKVKKSDFPKPQTWMVQQEKT